MGLDGWALLPALINSHCHLELSTLGFPPPPGPLAGWLREVIRRKRTAPAGAAGAGIAAGVRECLAGGQGTVADVLSFPEAADSYPADGPHVQIVPEVIASSPARGPFAAERALSARAHGRARIAGLSPHAPYTACAEAYRACAGAIRRRGGFV
jgi:cytosine/adenosine deaminase-related metal-dependent hydrolase